MHILNTEYFGTIMIPMDSHNTLEEESEHFTYIKLEAKGEILNSFLFFSKKRFFFSV